MAESDSARFLAGGGMSGAAARAVDWATTPLGPIEGWPASLRTAVGMVLHSRHPMLLLWGPELVQFYNDAYLPTFAEGKHPAAMGQRASECWRELWHRMEPQVQEVFREGRSNWYEDRLGQTSRRGRLEEAYWTYSFTPVLDEAGAVGGALVVSVETTARVIGARRASALARLAEHLSGTTPGEDLVQRAFHGLAGASHDVPYALQFLVDGCGRARLHQVTPEGYVLPPAVAAELQQCVEETARAGAAERLLCHGPLSPPGAPWPEPVCESAVLAGARLGAEGLREFLVLGVSARLAFDAAYRDHFSHLVALLGQARARLEALELEAAVLSERRSLMLQAPVAMAILRGPEHVCELVNAAGTKLMGGRNITGKPFVAAFPELAAGPLPTILDAVYRDGMPFSASEFHAPLARRDGQPLEDAWFKINLEPLRDARGEVNGVVAVAVEITEAVASRRALEKLYHEREELLRDLESAHRAKDEFLAMLGHEMRNPLAPIVTALHVMRMKGAGVLEQERAIIERQARHLVRLVDDLLDVERITRGKVTLARQRVSLHEVIATAVEIASPLLEERSHTLVLDVPREGFELHGDPQRLAQVFANLLGNAAKYTAPHGRLAARATLRGERIEIRIEDNGRGLSPEQLPFLFEPFVQGPRSLDRAEGGLGLGLAIVKNVVELHGGQVTAQSEGEGRGSTFLVDLPAHPDVARTPPPPREHEGPSSTPDPSRRRVLLVDDNEDLVELFSMVLERAGYEVQTAYDGPSALEVASAFRPDVAVLDLGLPVMDGYEVARRLSERTAHGIRLVAVSGYGQESDRERGRAVGFAAHLVKPVDTAELLSTVRG